jgi:DMSO reductase family type II enzyme heme b subunit
MPAAPTDPLWERIPAVNLPLVGQVIVDPRNVSPAIDMVSVKSIYNDKAIAFLVAWNDPTRGKPETGTAGPPDALAIQFPAGAPDGSERPYFLMGDSSHPTYLIRWRSDATRVEELTAAGLGQVQGLPVADAVGATGAAVYHEGQYRLLITRSLSPKPNGAPGFSRGRFTPIAFFAWDGGNGESGNTMSVSAWYYLILEEPVSAKRLVYPPLFALLAVAFELLIVRGAQRRLAENG